MRSTCTNSFFIKVANFARGPGRTRPAYTCLLDDAKSLSCAAGMSISLPTATPIAVSTAVMSSTQPIAAGIEDVRSISAKNTAGYISEVTRAISRIVSASKKYLMSPVETRFAMKSSTSEYSQNASAVTAVAAMRLTT